VGTSDVTVTEATEPAAPPAPADANATETRDRAEQIVRGAEKRGDLQLSDADRKAIVDQVVEQLGPMLSGLSDEDCNRIVELMIGRMDELGAFQAAPAPTTAAPAAGAPGPAPEVAAAAAAEVAAVQEPEKLSWAARHFGER